MAVLAGTNTVAPAATAFHPGIWRLQSAAAANSGFACTTSPNAFLLGGGEVFSMVFQTPAVFTTVTARMGFLDITTSAAPVDGAWLSFTTSGALSMNVAANSVLTTTALGVTLAASTWYQVRISVNAAATSILFEVFSDTGTLLGSNSITTNIPKTAGRDTGAGFVVTTSGAAVVDLLMVDFMSVTYSTVRTRGSTSGF